MLPRLIRVEQRILTLRLAEDMDYSTISGKTRRFRDRLPQPVQPRTRRHCAELMERVTTMQDSKQID